MYESKRNVQEMKSNCVLTPGYKKGNGERDKTRRVKWSQIVKDLLKAS